jgi:nitrite reductase/ring-hydroxylating ferredoxin subunit
MMRTGLSMKPTGWFQVGWSGDVPAGGVVPLRYFGEDLVAFRGLDGTLHILDAYCQHLGANLARGGCVVDGGIQCPFHGWVWNGQGRNVHIPYQERTNTARRIRAWYTAERNECIYLWHDADGGEPAWEVPDALASFGQHVAARTFHPAYPQGRSHFTDLHVHPQVVAENAVDPHHFRFVHRTPESPVVLEETADDSTWTARVGFGRRWADGVARPETMNTLIILWSGIGVSFNAEHTRDGIRVVSVCTTPVDDERTEIFATYWIDHSEADADPGHYERRLAEAQSALPDDINIWHHQKYLEPPGLATSEAAGFRKLRRWAASFYPASQAVAR